MAGRLAQATWGVRRKLGSARSSGFSSGWSSLGGSAVRTSKPAPAIQPSAAPGQGGFVHQAAAGGIDEQGGGLHRPQFRLADQTLRLGRQGTVQRQGIALPQHLGEGDMARPQGRRAFAFGPQNTHPEGLGQPDDAAAQTPRRPPQGRSVEVAIG